MKLFLVLIVAAVITSAQSFNALYTEPFYSDTAEEYRRIATVRDSLFGLLGWNEGEFESDTSRILTHRFYRRYCLLDYSPRDSLTGLYYEDYRVDRFGEFMSRKFARHYYTEQNELRKELLRPLLEIAFDTTLPDSLRSHALVKIPQSIELPISRKELAMLLLPTTSPYLKAVYAVWLGEKETSNRLALKSAVGGVEPYWFGHVFPTMYAEILGAVTIQRNMRKFPIPWWERSDVQYFNIHYNQEKPIQIPGENFVERRDLDFWKLPPDSTAIRRREKLLLFQKKVATKSSTLDEFFDSLWVKKNKPNNGR